MAVSKVADRGAFTAANGTAATTIAGNLTGTPAAGNFLRVRGSVNNSGTNGVAPTIAYSDSVSADTAVPGEQASRTSTYPDLVLVSTADPGAANAGVTLFDILVPVTTHVSGTTITITFGTSSGGRNFVVEEWSGIPSDFPFDYVELADANTAGMETDASAWQAADGNSTITSETSVVRTGAKGLRFTSVAAGIIAGRTASFQPVTAGRFYYFSMWVRSAATARTACLEVDFHDSGGGFLTETYSPLVATTTSGWTHLHFVVLAPASSTQCYVYPLLDAAGAGSEIHYFDDFSYGLVAITASGTATPTSESFTPATIDSAVIAHVAVEGPQSDTYTEDSDTLDGSWVALTEQGGSDGTATNNTTTEGGYKIVTGLSAQAHGATITSRDWASLIFALRSSGLPPFFRNRPAPGLRAQAPRTAGAMAV